MKSKKYYDADCDLTLLYWTESGANSYMFLSNKGQNISSIERIDATRVYVDDALTKDQIAQFISRTNSKLKSDFDMSGTVALKIRKWAGVSTITGMGGARPGSGNPNFVPKE